MKKLFLASSFRDAARIFAQFEKEASGKRVTFIPTASKVEKVVFYVAAGKKALEEMGMIVDELDVSTAPAREITAKIQGGDFIYVTGGNTFFLLQELMRTGADRLIAEQVHSGKLYIGESAGAMVASPNVEYAKGMDSLQKAPDLKTFDGLGLTSISPLPHYGSAPFTRAAQKIVDAYSSTLDLRPIGNKEAILVHDGKVQVKGG